MDKEKEMIEIIDKHMPRSKDQLNRLFEADSEIIAFPGGKILYNIDDFSEEDLFRDEDPYALGWNMAAGSISDILASGGKPRYYAHSLVVQDSWSQEYVDNLARGIAEVLKEMGVAFIGGDFGVSESWRYTGSVIGMLEGSPMLRSGAKVGDSIYITGSIGNGNVEAALKLYSEKRLIKQLTRGWKNLFQLRFKEAEIIKKYSYCCIDTSDGVFNALKAVSKMSGTGFVVGQLPYVKSGLLLAKALNIPKELLFLGECGEYELLFTLSKENEGEFIKEARDKRLIFQRIGEVTEQNTKLLRERDKEIDLTNYCFKARDYAEPKEYLREVLYFLRRLR